MDYEALQTDIYRMNDDELFYKKYYYARQQEYSLKEFLATLNMNNIRKRNLMIPELPETIPPRFEDSFFFDPATNPSVVTVRHNRYTPSILHEHTFFEIVYVYDGSCKQTISNNKITLSTGDLCIIPPGIKHDISVFDDTSVILNCLVKKSTLHNIFFNFLNNANILSTFFLNNIYSESGNNYIIFHTGNDHEIHRGFLYTYWESINQTLYFDQMISYTLLLIFGLLIRLYERSVELPVFTKKTDVQRFALLQFIQDNYKNISLDDVAERFNYTPEYASKLIKKATGLTFTQILQQVRIEKAQVLLHDTNMTIANIANEVGYENTEHFIRTFKNKMHMTPTEYRRTGYHML